MDLYILLGDYNRIIDDCYSGKVSKPTTVATLRGLSSRVYGCHTLPDYEMAELLDTIDLTIGELDK